jgi:hypothetical protein
MEVRKLLRQALSHLEMEEDQREELFNAIWENFESFEIVAYSNEDLQTFLTA